MTEKVQMSLFEKSYVKEAEKSVRLLKEEEEHETVNMSKKKINYGKKKYKFKITTSQIRKLLSILNDIYSFVVSTPANSDTAKGEDYLDESDEILKEKMQYLKMRCIYEAGRDEYYDKKTTGVRDFVNRTQILMYLDEFEKITSHKELHKAFIWIFHYMESLIAYHRFLGGKDVER